mgnify:CR=1 FL=1
MTDYKTDSLVPEPVKQILTEKNIFKLPSQLLESYHLIFGRINGYHPSRLKIESNEEVLKAIKKFLTEDMPLPAENIFTSNTYDWVEKKFVAIDHLIFLRRDLFCVLNELEIDFYYTNGLYAGFLEKVQTKVDQAFRKLQEEKEHFQLVVIREGGYSLKRFKLKPYEINLNDNYNDDLLPVHQRIMEGITGKNQKGLILLHGEPGTGKTTYIRHLTRLIRKKIIFMPPQFSVMMDTNTFLGLMSKYPDSVLIIEDADNIITDRKGGNNISIPGLLNIADGLLSYYLKTRIISTFNCNLSSIDPALMRKGRLIAMYEFKKLKCDKAQKLAKKLNLPLSIEQDTTLAEIYGHQDISAQQILSRRIGFLK